MLIIDDCSGDIKQSKKMINLLSTFRHYNISIIFVAQYAADLPPRIRELCFYTILFNQNTERSLRAVHQSYFQHVGNFNQFLQYFNNKLSQEHTFFFIDRIQKKCFVTKCPA